MGYLDAIDTARSGATLASTWLDAISDNIANANTIRGAGQEPYRARTVIASSDAEGKGVHVAGVQVASGTPDVSYDPTNPLADEKGYVTLPKVDMNEQMTNLVVAQRLYQMNINAMAAARDMAQTALSIGAKQ